MSLPLAPIVSIRRLSLVLGGPAAACTRRQAHSRDWDSTQNEAQSQRQHTVGVRRVAAFAVAFLGSTAGAALQAAAGGGRRRAAAGGGGRGRAVGEAHPWSQQQQPEEVGGAGGDRGLRWVRRPTVARACRPLWWPNRKHGIIFRGKPQGLMS